MNIPPPATPPQVNASVILPDEIIREIVLRLNVKSLMAMKCVCKSWKTFISDPLFVKMQLNLSKRNPHLTLLSKTYTRTLNARTKTVATIDVSCLHESTSNSINYIDYYLSDPYFRFEGIVGSCNGLICLHKYSWNFGRQKHWFYFCNPATRTKSETLLSIDWKPEFRLGFGYDNSSDTYKAVMVMLGYRNHVKTTAKVFTLGHNIWRDIQSLFPVDVAHSSLDDEVKYDGVYLSNSISWLFQEYHTTKKFLIISLDLGTETYTQLLLPSLYDESPRDNPTLCVLMACICFSHDFKRTHFVIWQLREFGVEESWTQFLKISYLNLDVESTLLFSFPLLPLCLSENGATLILATGIGNKAILYSWRDNRVKKRIKNFDRIQWCTAKDYVESFVSTRLVEKKARETMSTW